MHCRDARDALLEVTTGRTPPDRRRALAAHLAPCQECRVLAGEMEGVVALLRAAPDPTPPEGFWPGFMLRLEARVREPATLAGRVRRWLGTPPARAPVAATAAAVLIFALSSILLRPPAPSEVSPAALVAPYVTESMRLLSPHLEETVQIWQSGLGAQEVEPLLEEGP